MLQVSSNALFLSPRSSITQIEFFQSRVYWTRYCHKERKKYGKMNINTKNKMTELNSSDINPRIITAF